MQTLKKNLVLIGMRGSGKTSLGKTLASYLGFEFIDVDKTLEEGEGKKISEIVAKHDWDHFRDLETKYTKLASQKKDSVISTGGGVILREENITALKKNGVVVFIHSPIEKLAKRIEKSTTRPSLGGKPPHEELEEIWKERKDLYKKYCDVEIFFDFETKNRKTDLLRKSKIVLKEIRNFLGS